MPTARCRSCSAPMIWAKSPSGANLPLDAEPLTGLDDPRVTDPAVIYRLGVRDPLEAANEPPQALPVARSIEHLYRGTPLYLSHFATCPNATSFSKKGKHPSLGATR